MKGEDKLGKNGCYYLAADGKYYNGYMGSYDHIRHLKPMFDAATERMGRRIVLDMLLEVSDNRKVIK